MNAQRPRPKAGRPVLDDSPLPGQIKAIRVQAGLRQQDAARLIQATCRAWEDWEQGQSRMHPGLWAYFLIQVQRQRHPVPVRATDNAANTDDLVDRLRALAGYKHADVEIADEAADEIERLRARFWATRPARTKKESPATCQPDDDYTVSDSETAGMILHYLGFAVDPSLEPCADHRRDRIAKMIRVAIEADKKR